MMSMGLRLLTCARRHVPSRPCPYAPASWLPNLRGRRIHPEKKVTGDDDAGGRSVYPEVGVEGFAANHPNIPAGLHLPAGVDGDIRGRGHLYPGGTPVSGVRREETSMRVKRLWSGMAWVVGVRRGWE